MTNFTAHLSNQTVVTVEAEDREQAHKYLKLAFPRLSVTSLKRPYTKKK